MYSLEDPLDSPDFDPIAFINQNFPTGNIKYVLSYELTTSIDKSFEH